MECYYVCNKVMGSQLNFENKSITFWEHKEEVCEVCCNENNKRLESCSAPLMWTAQLGF